MKKSSFIALVLGTVSGILFGLGMCMVLLPEWNTFREGIIWGSCGLLLGAVTVIVWRRMTHKAPIRLTSKTLRAAAVGILGVLLLGVGMCLCMVWQQWIPGIVAGIAGIVLLLCLIPLIKGFTE